MNTTLTKEILYHSEVFLPEWFKMPSKVVGLEYSSHAQNAMLNDRYGQIVQWRTLDLNKFDLIEIGVVKQKVIKGVELFVTEKVSKLVVRGKYDSTHDITFALVPSQTFVWRVKTCWLNMNTDTHNTLDINRYATK